MTYKKRVYLNKKIIKNKQIFQKYLIIKYNNDKQH